MTKQELLNGIEKYRQHCELNGVDNNNYSKHPDQEQFQYYYSTCCYTVRRLERLHDKYSVLKLAMMEKFISLTHRGVNSIEFNLKEFLKDFQECWGAKGYFFAKGELKELHYGGFINIENPDKHPTYPEIMVIPKDVKMNMGYIYLNYMR